MVNYVTLMFVAVLGAVLASFLATMPGLHIYNVISFVAILAIPMMEIFSIIHVVILMVGMITGYSFLNTISGVFVGAPDDSTIFIVLPGQKFLMQGRGYEAAMITGLGSLGALVFLVLVSPFLLALGPIMRRLLTPHTFWIVGLVICYMVLSDWPKDFGRAKTKTGRLLEGWAALLPGISTLILSAILGFVMLNKTLTPVQYAFQGIMPALVGFFAVPWVLQNIVSVQEIPEQFVSDSIDIPPALIVRGVGAGCLGGSIAAFFPVVTGGVGGLIAGHATGARDDRLFVVSQGASKVVYYVGAMLLLFVPAMGLRRGGLAWTITLFYAPRTHEEYFLCLGAIVLSGAVSFFMLIVFSRWILILLKHVKYQHISYGVLIFIVTIVFLVTSWQGLIYLTVAAAIGLIPVLFHSRRSFCMGSLLIPICLNMAGVGNYFAHLLGIF